MPVLAIGAVVLEVAIIAIMAILLTYALELFAKAVAQIVPGFNIPGLGSLRDKITSGIGAAIGAVKNLVAPSLSPVINLFRDPVTFFQNMFNAIYTAINEAVTTAQWIINTAIPRAVNGGIIYSQQLYNQSISYTTAGLSSLRSYAEQLYNQAVSHANDLYNSVHAYALSLYNDAINHANDLYNSVHAYALSLYDQAIAHADTLYNQALGFATNAANSAVAHADALASMLSNQALDLYNKAIGYAGDAARAAEAAAIATVTGPLITDLPGIWPGLVDEIDGVIDTAADDFAGAIDRLKDLDLSIPVSIGEALTVAIPAVTALTRLAKDCTIPNCRNTSKFGRDLQALLGIVGDGAIFALLAELVADPMGGAHDVESTLGGLAGSAVDAGKHLLGVG